MEVTRINEKKQKNINFKKMEYFLQLCIFIISSLPLNEWDPNTLCLSFNMFNITLIFFPQSPCLLLALDFHSASGTQRPSSHGLITLVSLWRGVAKLQRRLSVARWVTVLYSGPYMQQLWETL